MAMLKKSSNSHPSSKAKTLAILGALVTGVAGVAMAVYSVLAGEETGGGALLAASALAFGLLATNLDRFLQNPPREAPAAIQSEPQRVSAAEPQPALEDDEDDSEEAPVLPDPVLVGAVRYTPPVQAAVSALNGSVNGAVMAKVRESEIDLTEAEPLSDREKEVLSLVAEGYSNKQVSLKLGIAERTVKNHMASSMAKLHASDRTHAVVTAVRLGWLDL